MPIQAFPASFLLFFYQLAFGGLLALAATPFHELSRGFYKSTAGVLFSVGLLGFWAKVALLFKAPSLKAVSVGEAVALFFYFFFILFFALYLISLWGERALFRARSFSLALLAGLLGLFTSSQSFSQAGFSSAETLIYPLSFFLSALLLGSVTVGMLIGHWYLIDTGQSIAPFIRIFKFFLVALIIQTVFLAALPFCLYWFGSNQTASNLKRLLAEHPLLFSSRFIASQVCPLILSAMIWKTLKIPQTMAATGLFYIALLGVFVGEILGRQILALTSLPF